MRAESAHTNPAGRALSQIIGLNPDHRKGDDAVVRVRPIAPELGRAVSPKPSGAAGAARTISLPTDWHLAIELETRQ
jgi:hypothetical protein